MADENKLFPESKQTLEALDAKVAELEQIIAQNKNSTPQKRDERVIVIITCLILGAICIVSVVVRLFIAQVNWLDPILLIIGLALCGLSLWTGFKFNLKDLTFEAKLREVLDISQKLINMLR